MSLRPKIIKFSHLWPFVVTVGIVLAVGFTKLYFNRIFNFDSPILLFFAAIAIACWYGGALQGLLAIVLSTGFILKFFVLVPDAPPLDLNVWLIRFGFYFLDCLVITMICADLRRSRNKAAASFRNLQEVERSLRLSESRLRRIFESNMIGMVFTDYSGRIHDANRYYLNLLGADEEQLANGALNWKDFTPAEHKEKGADALDRIRNHEEIQPFEIEYERANGQRVSVLINATRVEENAVVAFVLDLSERKRDEAALSEANNRLEEHVQLRTQQLTVANAELSRLVRESEDAAEKLRQSQSFLDSVIELIPNMIFVKDARELRFVRFNRAGEELLGQKRENLVGKNDFDFFSPQQAQFFADKDREVLRSGTMVDIPEEEISTPNGLRYLHTKKIPLLGKTGEPQYLLGISEDITEKKIAERQRASLMQAQLERAEAEKSAARLSILSEASAKLNESLDIHKTLPAFVNVLTKGFSSLCAIDLFNEKRQCFDRVAVQHDGSGIHDRLNDQQGIAEVYQSQKAKTQPAANGVPSRMMIPLSSYGKPYGVITFAGKTGAPPYDDLGLSIAQDLAKRVSLAMENAKLFSQANEASRAKSAFLANISHEIRTPLGAMLGFAELAMDSNLMPEQAGYISTIVRNGRELLRIVDEVLDLSKAEYNRIQIESIAFALPNLIEEVTGLLRVRADEKGLWLKVRMDEKLPSQVLSDPLRIRQILLNIVGNAIKFTETGGVSVEVGFLKNLNSDTRGQLHFLISDSGIGLNVEQSDKLFEPFVQADDSTTRKYGGTGLGLFLSRKIAGLLNGDVILESSVPGQGSRFRITVEVGLAANVATESQPVEASSVRQEWSGGAFKHHPKILVVDDAPDNRSLVTAFLKKMGIDWVTAENGREAVVIASKEDFDVILMDIQMPEMDGFAAMKELRARRCKAPIVALTAHAMKGDRERCLQEGFDDYLCKPISKASLHQCLSRHMTLKDGETLGDTIKPLGSPAQPLAPPTL